MRYINYVRLWVTALLLIMLLSGCELLRTDDGQGDITQPVNEPVAVDSQGDDLTLPPAQDTGSVIRFEPASRELVPGSTTTIDILVDDVVEMNGADVQFTFDPAVIQIDDADSEVEGVQLQPGNFLSSDFVVENIANNETGQISFIIIQIPPTPPVSGSGVLATLIVRATNEGASDLAFTSAQLTNSQIQLIPVTQQNGQIIVTPLGVEPTTQPTDQPTTQPTDQPTAQPTDQPTTEPTAEPTDQPTVEPTIEPTIEPTVEPTIEPTIEPTPQPTEPPQPQVKIPPKATFGICYWVKHKDSIHSIAKKYDTTPYAINVANDLYPPNHVYENQVLFIPFVLGHGPNVYEVQADEVTMDWIAEECNVDLDHLLHINNLGQGFDPPKDFPIIIPIPPFPPPSKFKYLVGPLPIVPPGCCGGPPHSYQYQQR